MPELPEVETTRQGLAPQLTQQVIINCTIHNGRLRWPVAPDLPDRLKGGMIQSLQRRGKYLLCAIQHPHHTATRTGTLIIHLGMSGSLRLTSPDEPLKKHDHVEIELSHRQVLRYHDPRRFGALLWTTADPLQHPLLRTLGIEPLTDNFSGDWLYQRTRPYRSAIKAFIMNSHHIVGIGNIYANEALFMAQIHPQQAAHALTMTQAHTLSDQIKSVLTRAITQGGTTLRDFINSQGQPGYFQQQLQVYDRAGQPCWRCHQLIQRHFLNQRASYYCPHCQRWEPQTTHDKTAMKGKKTP